MASSAPSTPSAEPQTFDSLCLFTFFWAVAILTHQAYHNQYNYQWHDTLLIVTAFFALVRPSSLVRLAALAAAGLVTVAVEMPIVYNHWLLVGLANLMILIVLATRPGRRADGSWDRGATYHALAPPLRLMLLGTYAFSFLAKLNRDFFDPQLSCAAITYPRLSRRLTILPPGQWTRVSAIWFTVLAEAAIPLLLTLRRTRVVGVFIALAFHMLMGLAAFYDFSAAAAGLLVLFLADDTPQRLSALASRYVFIGRMASACRRFARTPVSAPILIVGAFALFRNIGVYESTFSFSMRVWIVFTLVVVTALVLAVIERPHRDLPRAPHLTVADRLVLFGVLLTLVHAVFSEYLISAAASALIVLFLPRDLPRIVARAMPMADAVGDAVRRLSGSTAGLMIFIAAASVAYVVMTATKRSESPLYFVMLTLGTLAFLRLLWTIFERSGDAPMASHLGVGRPLYHVGLLLVVVNGLSPYVGLKTEHSFTMFSNIATEGDRWNHFIVPRQAKIFGMQDDLVRVVESSDQLFRSYANREVQFPYFKFRALMMRYPHIRISYERSGQRIDVRRVGEDPVLSQPVDWTLNKLLDFRPVFRRNTCNH